MWQIRRQLSEKLNTIHHQISAYALADVCSCQNKQLMDLLTFAKNMFVELIKILEKDRSVPGKGPNFSSKSSL